MKFEKSKMKIVIASDSFKESMTAFEACHAIEKGIKAVDCMVDCLLVPMADGGEGTMEVLIHSTNAKLRTIEVKNPFLEPIVVQYGLSDEGVAIMDTSIACGIHLIKKEMRDPTRALTYGLGQMIKDAIENGANKIIVGLGGSGTNDGGFGMLYALGAKFYDEKNQELPLDYQSIMKISHIDLSAIFKRLENCEIIIASDVENVYTGPSGATYTFARQKGASENQLEYLEQALLHLQQIFLQEYLVDLSKVKKSGAAGGLGGAFYMLKATMKSGIEMVLDVTSFKEKIKDANYVFTGEGSIDGQTINGKTISGIARVCKEQNVPVIALGGRVTKEANNLYDIGVTSMFSITNEAKPLDRALIEGKETLEQTVSNILRLLK